jgi:site-specific recombinase
MSTKEIKTEIQKSLNNVPDSVLQDILDFLKQAEKQPADRLNLTKNLRDILTEDKELLDRLAR